MTTLSLRCAEFHGNLTAGLLSMLETEQYANVTIAIEGQYLKAHQMVLSIYSPYFNALLQSAPCKHPIIFIQGVKYNIMKHLLRFMYEGETAIAADDLQCFIETAQELQMKWLTKDNEHNTEASKHSADTSLAENTKQLDHEPIQQDANKLNITNSNSEATDIEIKLEVEDHEDVMNTDCELVENTNGNIETTIADSSTHTDTDRFLVETIDETVDVEIIDLEAADNRIIKDEQLDEQEEIIDLDVEVEDTELLQPLEQAPSIPKPKRQFISPRRKREGEPVNVLFYKRGGIREKCFVNKFPYNRHYMTSAGLIWQCVIAQQKRGCRANVLLTSDKRIIFRNHHNHPPKEKVSANECTNQEVYHRTYEY